MSKLYFRAFLIYTNNPLACTLSFTIVKNKMSKKQYFLYEMFLRSRNDFLLSSGNIRNLNMDLSNQPLVKFTNRDRILNVLPCAVRHIHQNPWLASEARSWKAVSVCGWAAGDGRSCMCLPVIQCPVYVEPQCSLPEGNRTIQIWWPRRLDLFKHVCMCTRTSMDHNAYSRKRMRISQKCTCYSSYNT